MPSSRKGPPFTRKQIALAFFNLDLSEVAKLEAEELPTAPSCDPPATHESFDNSDAKEMKHITIFTLPIEIRLRIFDLLLVSRFDREQNPSCAVGNSYQKLIILHMIQAPQYRTMEPSILLASKQIYREANPMLYSRNVFAISEPVQMFGLIAQIGTKNVKLMKSLDIWVPWMAEIGPWLKLLHVLAKDASGLRVLEIGWGAKVDFPWELEQGAKERGLGDNLQFVHALGQIQSLEKLVIEGYYATHWPAYLEKETGAQVHAKCGHYLDLREGDLDNEELELEKLKHEVNERELQSLRKYQHGTESLIP